MIETRDPRGTSFKVPGLPLELGDKRLALRNQPPQLSENARELLTSLGYTPPQVDAPSTSSFTSADRPGLRSGPA